MSERQMRRRRTARRSIVSEIKNLERQLMAEDDQSLLEEAQGIANEEVAEVTTRGETDVEEDIDEENERANDNWPMQASERIRVAERLVRIAEMLIKG